MEQWDMIQEFLHDKNLSVPAGELLAFVGLVTLFSFLGRRKLALITILLFVGYWAFILNMESLLRMSRGFPLGIPLLIFGATVLVGLIIAAFFHDED